MPIFLTCHLGHGLGCAWASHFPTMFHFFLLVLDSPFFDIVNCYSHFHGHCHCVYQHQHGWNVSWEFQYMPHLLSFVYVPSVVVVLKTLTSTWMWMCTRIVSMASHLIHCFYFHILDRGFFVRYPYRCHALTGCTPRQYHSLLTISLSITLSISLSISPMFEIEILYGT
jgi:hypothetical protein